MTEGISVWLAFSAGLLSFLSPCVLPLVPVYLASLVGPEIFDDQSPRSRMAIFLHSFAFVIGFSIIFSLWGAGAGLIGSAFIAYTVIIRWVVGSLLILLGLFLLAALKVPWLNFERRLTPSRAVTTGYLRSFLTGGVFSLAWTPCVGPMLGGILTLALGSETAGYGAYLLAIYSLGLGMPFLIIGAAFDLAAPVLRRIYRYSTAIYIVSGLLLIVVGILTLTNRLAWF